MVGTSDWSSGRLCTASRICVKGTTVSGGMFQLVQVYCKRPSGLVDVPTYPLVGVVRMRLVAG